VIEWLSRKKPAEITMPYYRKYSPSSNWQDIICYNDEQRADPAIEQRISKVLTQKELSIWEKDFLQSIFICFSNKKQLSQNQYAHLEKIENKYSETKLAAAKEFADSFSAEKRNDMRIIASIYRNSGSPYHRNLVENILDNPNFIPTFEQWDKFMNNKYAQGYLENAKSIPKYEVADTVTPSSLGKYHTWKCAIVIDNSSEFPSSHGTGGKRYVVLPYGETRTVTVQEREIKKVR
jgi:hypothetical protein